MRPQVILVVTLALLGVLADLPLGKGSSWPCCDNCGFCDRQLPPDCQCDDISVDGCHPECKNCVKVGSSPVVTYRCDDVLTNFCEQRCTPAPAPAPAPEAVFLGRGF